VNCLSRTVVLWIILLCVFAPPVLAQYVPPAALSRDALQGTFLNHSPTQYTMYTWDANNKKIRFMVFSRPTPTDEWPDAVEQVETVSYYITAVAPVYAGAWDSMYVIGVLSEGKTIIERWTVVVTVPSGGGVPTVTVTKKNILVSEGLTTIRAAAVSPNEQFLVVQRLEINDIVKVSLPVGATTTLLTVNTHPELQYYDFVQWQKHTTLGDAFRVLQGRNGDPINHTGCILIWDANLDGVPDKVEDLTGQRYRDRGFLSGDVWEPLRTLYVFD
jgi:hypothetical protein